MGDRSPHARIVERWGEGILSPDGALDPTFAQGGMQLFDMGGMDLAGAVVVQPDGKVVAAGTSAPELLVTTPDFHLIRAGRDAQSDGQLSDGDGELASLTIWATAHGVLTTLLSGPPLHIDLKNRLAETLP
mgnify:CR=1 FL=1